MNQNQSVTAKEMPKSIIYDTIPDDCDKELLKKIKAIIQRGNDAEVRQRANGKYAVYEIKKNIV